MSNRKATAINLPLSRVAKIMQSAAGVNNVNHDVIALTTKATELFLSDLAQKAYNIRDGEYRSNTLEYEDIQDLVCQDPRYDFLKDTTPPKLKFGEALELVKEQNKKLVESGHDSLVQNIAMAEELGNIDQMHQQAFE